MDYFELASAAIGGAIGGMLGALLSQRFKNKTAKMVATVLPVVLMIQIAPIVVKKLNIREKVSPASPFEMLVGKVSAEYESDPGFVKAFKGMNRDQAQVFMQEKSKLGMKRLPLEDLQNWNDLRLKMSNASPEMCAGFWTGKGVTQEVVQGALLKMEERDALAWLRIGMKAGMLEIESAPFTAPPADAIQVAVQEILKTLNKEDAARFSAVLVSGVNAENADACWSMLTLLKSASSLQPEMQEQFLRAFATL